jgi:hypothetical protein
MTSEAEPWAGCRVCGHADHTFEHHLNEVAPPEFVRSSVVRLRQLELAGSDIHPLLVDTSDLVENEEGARKAWAIWLTRILEELEDAADAPDVAAEIEDFLLGGYSA